MPHPIRLPWRKWVSLLTDFNPETVELTPYRDRQQQATVTAENLEEAREKWEAEPPELDGEDVALILDAEAD